MRSTWGTLGAVMALGCGQMATTHSKTTAKIAPAPPEAWGATENNPSATVPAYLSNGLIGVRIARTGGGLDYEGHPLSFLAVDDYEPAGEEKIRPLPSPVLVSVSVGNKTFDDEPSGHDFLKSGGTSLDPRKGSDYSQRLDYKTGILTTTWNQAVAGIGNVRLICDSIVHPTQRVVAQRWTLESDKPTTFSIRTLDYGGPSDPQKLLGSNPDQGLFLSFSAHRAVTAQVHAEGYENGHLSSDNGFLIQEGKSLKGKPMVFDRVLSFSPHFATPLSLVSQGDLSKAQKAAPRPFSFPEVVQAATAFWKKRWQSDIEIDGPVQDQQAIRSMLFALRSSIAPSGTTARSISPFALSDPGYYGHVFWDADIWVLSSLLLSDPDLAQSILDYRLNHLAAAKENFQTWQATGRPTGTGKVPDQGVKTGIKFPWESSESGHETVPGPSKFEDHITGSVLWGLTQGEALGLASPQAVGDAAKLAANFYLARSERSPRGLEIRGTMSPDENHTGNNDLYTNLLAQWLHAGRDWNHKTAESFALPHDETGLTSYDNDPFRGYKQAAALLSVYPLQYPPAEAQAKSMLARFGGKAITNGPAMTESVEATVLARQGLSKDAYDRWQGAWKPFTQDSLLQFSETRTKSVTYFTTGAGGSLQTVLYGFLGIRLDRRPAARAQWTIPVRDGYFLSGSPHLPSQWKSVTFHGLSALGKRYDLKVDSRGSKLSPW